jgi:hypothetical protein
VGNKDRKKFFNTLVRECKKFFSTGVFTKMPPPTTNATIAQSFHLPLPLLKTTGFAATLIVFLPCPVFLDLFYVFTVAR